MRKFSFCLLVTLFMSSASGEVIVGTAAPDFDLQGSDGHTYTLSQFRGKESVIIAFFPKVFTGG